MSKLRTIQYLFNFVYIMFVNISSSYLSMRYDTVAMIGFLKATILIAGSLFYTSDYIKYLKDKDNIVLAQKTMRSALINHVIVIGLLAVVFVAENYFL